MSSVAYVACDAAVALHRTCREQASRGNLVLATSIIASSLAFIDGSVATVALPAIGRALNGDAATLQWIVNIYLLPLTAFLLAGGDLGDRFGSGRVLAWGVGLFTIASIACAVAPNLGVLLASRAAQGVAAAIFLPNSLAVLGAAFPEESRARAVGIWAGTTALAGAFGPVIGGALVDRVGWRSIFLLNLPFGILALVMALRYAPPRIEAPERAIDLAGMALAVLALGALNWAVTEASGPMGWTDRAMMSAFAGALLLPMFVRLEKRRGERAMLPMSLFRSRAFSGLSVFTVLLYGVWSGLAVLLPYVMISGLGFSSFQAGAALVPIPLAMAILSPFMGALSDKIGARPLLIVGPMLIAVGCCLMLFVGEGSDYWRAILPSLGFFALGMVACAGPLTSAVLTAATAAHVGAGSAFNSTAARGGGLFATAAVGGVFSSSGPALIEAFHHAAIVGAVLAVAAAACLTLFAIEGPRKPSPQESAPS